jgi:alginate O-acetyltransferase complex protein AlgJ
MTHPSDALPAGDRTRAETAHVEVGRTAVSPVVARFVVAAFLAAIAAVPLLETAGARGGALEVHGSPWSNLADLSNRIRLQLSDAALAGAPWWRRIRAANRELLAALSAVERDLDDQSLLGRLLRRPAQRLLTGWLGSGNERVYAGRHGWLFYRADVEYITGRSFLESAQQQRRIAAASEWTAAPHPDPRVAIHQFHRDLQARGISLVVVPTPVKAGVHPEMLAGGYPAVDVLHNRSYPEFVDELRNAGVLVFEPGAAMAEGRHADPLYLRTDTHWLPETMEAVAERLGAFIDSHVRLPAVADPGYRIQRLEVRNVGDTARMLDLPPGDPLFPAESVWLRRILLADGSLWRGSRAADVLLLGDSFTNVYALASMGWGTSAGFAEQLSYILRRPIDRLTQNDEGAFATRRMLQQDRSRLDGKRVVIFQFAARELTSGDWRILPLSPSRPGE